MGSDELPVFPVLLAGGSGTRLWPVSRELHPKQLARLVGRESLIQTTLRRLVPPFAAERVRVVCGEQHRHEIARHMEAVGIPADGRIISEPAGRNTAPAVLLACLLIREVAGDAVLGVFPADHVIGDLPAFHEKLAAAVRLAAEGRIVTFGITPSYPETGYGYVEAEDRSAAPPIRRFVEKPDAATARAYLAAGNFYWNSGMFAFRASVLLEEFEAYQPGLLQAMRELLAAGGPIAPAAYQRLPDLSLDVAIMEKTRRGVVLPSDFGWSDIGSWKSLYDFLPKDPAGNVVDGDVITQEARNCLILANERLIAANRVEGLVVVETPDAIFVSGMDHSRDVKSIAAELKRRGRSEAQRHRTVRHPWGSQKLLEAADGRRIIRLAVHPRAAAVLEEAEGAAVHLLVLSGRAAVGAGRKRRRLAPGAAAVLPGAPPIRIENRADETLQVLAAAVDGAAAPDAEAPAVADPSTPPTRRRP